MTSVSAEEEQELLGPTEQLGEHDSSDPEDMNSLLWHGSTLAQNPITTRQTIHPGIPDKRDNPQLAEAANRTKLRGRLRHH